MLEFTEVIGGANINVWKGDHPRSIEPMGNGAVKAGDSFSLPPG